MASKNPKNRPAKNTPSESSTTKWLRIILITFSIILILSMVLSMVK